MTPLLIATTNRGKIREIRRLLSGHDALRTLADLPALIEPEETGTTFGDNAALKARFYAGKSGLMTVAEDSGLVIDSIGGAPGVHSARYPGATYPAKFQNLYAALAGKPRPWTARYVCAVAVAVTDAALIEAGASDPAAALLFHTEATVEGEIWPEPRGTHGFGYDPIFYYPPYGRTFGEVEDQEKLAVAHRGRAFRQLADWLGLTRDEPPR